MIMNVYEWLNVDDDQHHDDDDGFDDNHDMNYGDGDNHVLIMILFFIFLMIAGNSVVMKPSEMTTHVMLPFISLLWYIMIYVYFDCVLSILVM